MSIGSIEVTTERPLYYSGDVIRGRVTLEVIDAIRLDKLTMHLDGISDVEWSETDHNSDSTRFVTYSSRKSLLSLSQNLVVDDMYLTPGVRMLHFEFQTPSDLPSSFKGSNGKIRYKLHLKRPGSWFSKKRLDVKILERIDTNQPQYAHSVLEMDEKTVCCLCCQSGELSIEASTDRAAYCPGEEALLTAAFVNGSSRLSKPYAELVQTIRYYAEGSSKSDRKRWRLTPTETQHNIAEGGATKWSNLSLELPQCSPSIKTKNIQVSYCILVALDIEMAINLGVSLPVVIGTIPLHTSQLRSVEPSQVKLGVPEYSAGSRPTAPPLDVHEVDISPPSYFEAILARNDPPSESDSN